MDLTPLYPRQQTPSLSLPTVGGDTWTLSEQAGENFTMVVFYRGLHCPICGKYLRDLNSKADEFKERGVNVVVASSDAKERAQKSKEDWKLDNLTVAYGLDLDKAREWGLYISTSRGKDLNRRRRARPLQRARPLPHPPRRDALLRRSPDHALR